MQYLKRFWDESRGDEYDAWGNSIWYFEVSSEGYPMRQIEVYTSGPTLKYDENNSQDHYGGLTDQLLETDEYDVITKDDFEIIWQN